MISVPVLDLGLRLTKEAKMEAALAYPPGFITTYFSDAKGEPIEFEEFHLEIVDALTDPTQQRVLLLAPADHGKTSLTRWCLDYLACRDRNTRMMLVANNATDAEQLLGAIERDLSDPNSLLVKDFGDLRGDLWQTTQFNIKGRSIVYREPTLAAYGTGSNVFGHRSDLIVADDLLNLDNAGPYVTERTRAGVHEWFFQGLLKVAGASGKIVVIGTVMDKRDLYHELMDARHGFKVIVMRALLDDERRTVLWPKRNPYSYLAAQRESDYTSFMKRYQNVALDPSTATFDGSRLAGCLDRTRGWGEITDSMKAAGATRVLVAFDPASGKDRRASYCGIVVGCYDPRQEPPRTFYVLEMWRFRAPLEEIPENVAIGVLGQIETIMAAHERYGAAMTVIEANAQNQFLLQSAKLRQFQRSGHLVEPHYTSAENKYDPDVGLASMAAMFNAGLIRFPYGDERSRKEVDDFLQAEVVPHPMGRFTDRLMALWFFVLRAGQASEPRYKTVFRKSFPLWARKTGLPPQPMKRAV